MVYLGNEARPPHWFSMKQCAAQYETLLNSVLGSRRKKRTEKSTDPHEQPSLLIYNILKNGKEINVAECFICMQILKCYKIIYCVIYYLTQYNN